MVRAPEAELPVVPGYWVEEAVKTDEIDSVSACGDDKGERDGEELGVVGGAYAWIFTCGLDGGDENRSQICIRGR